MSMTRDLTPEQAQAIRTKRVLMLNDANVSDDEMTIFYVSEDWRSLHAHSEKEARAASTTPGRP